jgi:hypothetical protein
MMESEEELEVSFLLLLVPIRRLRFTNILSTIFSPFSCSRMRPVTKKP